MRIKIQSELVFTNETQNKTCRVNEEFRIMLKSLPNEGRGTKLESELPSSHRKRSGTDKLNYLELGQ